MVTLVRVQEMTIKVFISPSTPRLLTQQRPTPQRFTALSHKLGVPEAAVAGDTVLGQLEQAQKRKTLLLFAEWLWLTSACAGAHL